MKDPQKRAGYVWLISATALGGYATLGLLDVAVPGVEELVGVLSSAQGWQFYVAGFLAILLEGLYVIGNFFPGSTIVILLAILSGFGGWMQFALTIFSIFVGWCIAGAINIYVAHKSLRRHAAPLPEQFEVKDRVWLTWFPAFRANYEVAQVVAGGNPLTVLISSIRVRFFASLGAAVVAAVATLLIDINTINNEEGFISVLLIVCIMVVVGIRQIRATNNTNEIEYERAD